MNAKISIHDNRVLSYTIDCVKKTIVLHTVFYDSESHEYTDEIFSEVAGYHFEGDNFQTILFDVNQVSPEEVYSAYRDLFERGKNYAWPFDYSTEQELLRKLNDKSVKGFVVSSSYGIEGFVLAEGMKITSSKRDQVIAFTLRFAVARRMPCLWGP